MVPLASNIKNEIAKPDCDQESGEILLPKSGLMKLPKVSLTKLAGLVSLLTVLIFSLTITTTYGSTISIFRETPRIAVLLSGRIGVGGKNGGPNMISEAMNSHTKHVFPGFESYGYAVDAFIHSNEPEYEAELLERYHPVSYKIETGKPNSGFLDSLQEAMDVLDNYISNSEARYDWVLWTRFDAYYPRAFEIPKLNNSLFYIPYWCKASGIIIYKDDERVCRQLNYFLPHDATGIPDFWFLSNYEMFRTVMKNISSDFANNKFATGGTAAWHGEMFGRLKQSGVPVGRYWYHHLDYDYIRMISNEEGDLFGRHTCWNQTLEWLYSDEFVPRNPAAERKLGEASYCPNTASYCGCGEKGKGFFPTALG